MYDGDMILELASTWIDIGGDSEGFASNWEKILNKIREMEAEEKAIQDEQTR